MATETLPSEIVPLESIAPHPNLLVYSRSGVGKTVFSTSDDSVLLLNTEPEGEISARNLGSKARQWKIRTPKDLDAVYEWAMSLADKGKPIPFKWFVLDSLTTYQRMDMDDILAEGLSRKSDKDPWVPEWKDYQRNQRRIVRRVTDFNALPVNMLYTCLTMNPEDEEGNEFVFPQIHGKEFQVAEQVCALMTSYGYLFTRQRFKMVDGKKKKDGIERLIQWETIGPTHGKDRTMALAPGTILPDRDALKHIRMKMEAAALKAMKTEAAQQKEGK